MNLELLLAEAEESSSGIDLLLPATSELVAGIAAFAIVFFFIWKWALPALNETLESRASVIEGQINLNLSMTNLYQMLIQKFKQSLMKVKLPLRKLKKICL